MLSHKRDEVIGYVSVFMMLAMLMFLCCTIIAGFLTREFRQGRSLKQIKELVVDAYHCADENLIFENEFVYAGNWMEARIGWDADCVTAYNPTYRLEGNYIVNMMTTVDVSRHVEEISNLCTYCDGMGVDFSYICLPNKLDRYTDTDFDGKYQMANQNADRLLLGLEDRGIDYLDVRKNIPGGGIRHHDLFFGTDHHWKPRAGLLAAGQVAEYINETYGFVLDLSVFDPGRYKEEVYNDYFLGSLGKKLTLAKVRRDDFSLYYPNFETKIEIEIPDKNFKCRGDFSVLYDYGCMSADYHTANPYAAYFHGDRPFVRVHNYLADNQKKILIIKDSYNNVMLPFGALAVSDLVVLDLRHFDGSVRSVIREEKPDLVLVSYGVDCINTWQENWLFDFR